MAASRLAISSERSGETMEAQRLIEAEGLVGALEVAVGMVQLASGFPTWSLPEADVSAGVAAAQRLGQASQTLTAVLARRPTRGRWAPRTACPGWTGSRRRHQPSRVVRRRRWRCLARR